MTNFLADPLFPLFIGAAVTWIVAWFYYKRAGDELRAEAKSLHAATSTIVYLLQHPDAKTEVRRDDQGRIAGIVVYLSGSASMSFSGSATLTTAKDGA